MFNTLADVKAANKAIGHHWFDQSTIKFFNSRIESKLVRGRWFISSSAMEADGPRQFKIHSVRPNGAIDTLPTTGDVTWFKSLQSAREALREIIKQRDEPTRENQLYQARLLLHDKGPEALDNPHAMIGRECGCGTCFCCIAAEVLAKESK